MNRLLTSRLSAATEIRQIEASNLADAAADSVDRAFAAAWRRVVLSIRTPLAYQARDAAMRGLLALLPVARTTIADSLNRIATWGHRTARANLGQTLPLSYLQAATVERVMPESLLENTSIGGQPRPGVLELILKSVAKGDGELGLTPGFAEIAFGAPKPEDRKQAFLDLLFPPPPRETVDEIVYAKVNGLRWDQRLEFATRTSATPQQMAEIVAQSVSSGQSNREIERQLLPVVDGLRSTARRIARTEGLRVAQEIQTRAWDGLGDMLLGYQIRAVLDERTRSEHRARNGTIYYREPKPGQKGMEECPRPPLEADGAYAWNCRCTLTPALAPPDYLDPSATKLFRDAQSELVPDPAVYSDWFAMAGERRQRLAVGTKRFSAAREALGGQTPGYEMFVNPDDETGTLLPASVIASESPWDRIKRIDRVRSMIAERRELVRRVAMMGI